MAKDKNYAGAHLMQSAMQVDFDLKKVSADQPASAEARDADLKDFVFLFDLDDTITRSSKHIQQSERGTIEFVPGTLELIANLYSRGVKIAIITHSGWTTPYSEAALAELSKRGLNNIPYVSLSDVVELALNTEILTKTEVTNVYNERLTSICYRSGFKVFIKGHNLSNEILSRTLVSKFHSKIIKLFGKGACSIFGEIAIERLGIAAEKFCHTSVCTVGDAITDVMHAKHLKEALGLKEAFGFWLSSELKNEKDVNAFYAEYAEDMIKCRSDLSESNAKHFVNLRSLGVHVLHGARIPENFDPDEARRLSATINNQWEEIFDQTAQYYNDNNMLANVSNFTLPSARVPTSDFINKHQVKNNVKEASVSRPWKLRNGDWYYQGFPIKFANSKMTITEVEDLLATPKQDEEGIWYHDNKMIAGAKAAMTLLEVKKKLQKIADEALTGGQAQDTCFSAKPSVDSIPLATTAALEAKKAQAKLEALLREEREALMRKEGEALMRKEGEAFKPCDEGDEHAKVDLEDKNGTNSDSEPQKISMPCSAIKACTITIPHPRLSEALAGDQAQDTSFCAKPSVDSIPLATTAAFEAKRARAKLEALLREEEEAFKPCDEGDEHAKVDLEKGKGVINSDKYEQKISLPCSAFKAYLKTPLESRPANVDIVRACTGSSTQDKDLRQPDDWKKDTQVAFDSDSDQELDSQDANSLLTFSGNPLRLIQQNKVKHSLDQSGAFEELVCEGASSFASSSKDSFGVAGTLSEETSKGAKILNQDPSNKFESTQATPVYNPCDGGGRHTHSSTNQSSIKARTPTSKEVSKAPTASSLQPRGSSLTNFRRVVAQSRSASHGQVRL